jgi:DNA-binding SARP family transcriptional activator
MNSREASGRTQRSGVRENQPMTALQLNFLGVFDARIGAGEALHLPLKKGQALLAYVALNHTGLVSRDKLASLLWSTAGSDQARQSLRQTLFGLRKELARTGHPILIEEGDYLRLDHAAVGIDVTELQGLAGSDDVEELQRAASLYRGEFLDGLSLGEERFDQWMAAERIRLRKLGTDVYQRLLEKRTASGDPASAIAFGQRALDLDPLLENVHRALIRLYMRQGDRNAALAQFDTCARVLKRELHTSPVQETRRLQQEILQLRAGEPSRTFADAPPENRTLQRILVVEDNVLSRELAQALLNQAGYSVVVASNGAEALMTLGKGRVDLMVIDVDLPYLNGVSLLSAARQNGINAPAIFVSGLPGEEVEVRAFESGAIDFIRKPFRNSVLLSRVAKAIQAVRVA